MALTARFTPSVLDGDLLEELFVGREHLVADAVGRIERAARSEDRSARLFVGPRGAGKTHLLSLVAHRARSLPGFGSTFQVAWLPEDMWTVDGYDDLVEEIVDAIEPAVEAGDRPPIDRLRAAVAAHGPVVVLVENLDRVFGDMGEEGQRRLRALIENDRSLLLIATTTRLDDELRSTGFPLPDDDDQPAYFREADWPFYGFFDTHELTPFTLDQATEMLSKIASASGDDRLAAELEEPTIRRRLAAIDRLASGQPRMWALLAAGLSIEGLDELVEALMTRFDDLTPYFQSQMQTLSPQERKVVRALADAPGSLNVGQIAERSGIGDKSVARTITGLRKKGWLRLRTGPIVAKADGRLSYYDLAEPLARLAFQLKESRGRPVRTVVEFLKHWFDAESLAPLGTDPTVDAYLTLAGTEARSDPWLRVARSLAAPDGGELDPADSMFAPPLVPDATAIAASLASLDDAVATWQAGDPGPLLRQPASIYGLIEEGLVGDPEGHRLRTQLARLALDVAGPAEWVERADAMFAAATDQARAEAASVAAVWRARAGDLEVATEFAVQATLHANDDDRAWLATRLLQFGADALALRVIDSAAKSNVAATRVRLCGLRAAALHRLDRIDEEGPMWRTLVDELDASDAPPEDQIDAALHLGNVYIREQDRDQSVALLTDVVDRALDVLGPAHGLTLIAQGNLAIAVALGGESLAGLAELRRAVGGVAEAYGITHPFVFEGRWNLIVSLRDLDQLAEARAEAADLVGDVETHLGPGHWFVDECRALQSSLVAHRSSRRGPDRTSDGGELVGLGDDALGAEEGPEL